MNVVLASATQAGWVPSFVDNFNSGEINAAKWKTSKSNSADVNLGYFAPGAIAVEDGKLQLRVRQAPLGGRPYMAGAVTTEQTFSQLHGYFEIRARMAKGRGFWPAFWLLPASGYWSSEIDIVEYAGAQPQVARYAYHYDFAHRPEDSVSIDTGEDLSEDFHTYAIGWRSGRLDFYLDGALVHTIVSDNIKDEAMYLILNLAVSSNQTDWKAPDASTSFNESFEIDYVRVYRYDPDAAAGYAQIPGPADIVPDTRDPSHYVSTSIDVTLSDLDRSYEVLPAGANIEIDADIAVKALGAGGEGYVRIFLKRLKEYRNGRLSWSAPVAQTGKLSFSLDEAGDRTNIPARLPLSFAEPGLYKLDILAWDAVGARLFHKNDLKRVQVLEGTSEPVMFDAFARTLRAYYSGQSLQGGVDFQILEAIDVPHVEIVYSLYGPESAAPIETWSSTQDFNDLERMSDDLFTTLPGSVELTPNHFLRISISDSIGRFTPVDVNVPLREKGSVQGKHVATRAKIIDGRLLMQTELVAADAEDVETLSYVYKVIDDRTGAVLQEFSGTANDFVILDDGAISYAVVREAGALQPGNYDLAIEVRAGGRDPEKTLFNETVNIAAQGESYGTYALEGGGWSTNFHDRAASDAKRFLVVYEIFDDSNERVSRVSRVARDFTEVEAGGLVNASFEDPGLALPAGDYRVETTVFRDGPNDANRIFHDSSMIGVK